MCWIEIVQNMVRGEEVYEYRKLTFRIHAESKGRATALRQKLCAAELFHNISHSKVVSHQEAIFIKQKWGRLTEVKDSGCRNEIESYGNGHLLRTEESSKPSCLYSVWYRTLRNTHEHCHSLFVIRCGNELQKGNGPPPPHLSEGNIGTQLAKQCYHTVTALQSLYNEPLVR
jgi:hypothetical protein